jgi:hypothetical protein
MPIEADRPQASGNIPSQAGVGPAGSRRLGAGISIQKQLGRSLLLSGNRILPRGLLGIRKRRKCAGCCDRYAGLLGYTLPTAPLDVENATQRSIRTCRVARCQTKREG